MVYKLLETVLTYIEDLETRHKFETIAELKGGIGQEISSMEEEKRLIETILTNIEELEERHGLKTIAELKGEIRQGILVREEKKKLAFCVYMRHSSESCPLLNDEVMKKLKETFSRRGEIAEKHGVKILRSCHSVVDHLMLYTVEAPSMQAVEDYLEEVGFALWNDIRIQQVQAEDECQSR